MASIGDVLVSIRADISDFSRKVGSVIKELGGLGTILTGVGATLAAVFSVQSIARFFGHVVDLTKEMEQSQAKLAAVLKATGNAAGLSAHEINKFADAMAKNTLFDDEAIRNASATMATFRSVQGDTFKEAIRLAGDLSTVFGGDLQSSTLQLGKALQDPVSGLTALKRIGVQFNETQKNMIAHFVEVGDQASAQKVILKELAHEVGGASEGVHGGLTGAIKDLSFAWNELLERATKTSGIFGPVIKTFEALATWLNQLAPTKLDQLREANERIAKALNGTGEALGQVAKDFGVWEDAANQATTAAGVMELVRQKLVQVMGVNSALIAVEDRREKAEGKVTAAVNDGTAALGKQQKAVVLSHDSIGRLSDRLEMFAQRQRELSAAAAEAASELSGRISEALRQANAIAEQIYLEQFGGLKKKTRKELGELEKIWSDAATSIARAFTDSLFRKLVDENGQELGFFAKLKEFLKRALEQLIQDLLTGELAKLLRIVAGLISGAANGIPPGGVITDYRSGFRVPLGSPGGPTSLSGRTNGLVVGPRFVMAAAPVFNIVVGPAPNPMIAARDATWVAALSESMHAAYERGFRP